MAAAAIPLIASAITAGGSMYSAHRANKRSPEEKSGMQTQQRAGASLERTGSQLTEQGQQQGQQAGRYFSTLAGGNRAATTQMLAPDLANINSIYGGTQRTLARFLRGPDRDFQLGELARQKAGAAGSLFSAARTRAVENLTQLSQFNTGTGVGATGAAAGVGAGLSAGGFANRQAGNATSESTGRDAGSLIFQLLQGAKGGVGGAGIKGSPLSTIPFGPRNLPGTIPTSSPIQGLAPVSANTTSSSRPYGGIRF